MARSLEDRALLQTKICKYTYDAVAFAQLSQGGGGPILASVDISVLLGFPDYWVFPIAYRAFMIAC